MKFLRHLLGITKLD